MRQRVCDFAFVAKFVVFAHIRQVSCCLEDTLSALDFAEDGVVQAVHQPSAVFQVVHDGGGVRQGFQARESRATLVVHQHKRQHVRVVADGLAQHDGAQHFGFTGTGRTNTQAVRSHAVECGFFDVQAHGPTRGVHTVGHVEEVLDGTRCPQSVNVVGVKVRNAQQAVQGDGFLQGRVGNGVFH